MEDRKLEAAESLALIGRMIENTRSRMVRNSGRPLLAWGYATVLTTLAVWGAVLYFQDPRWNYLWLMLPLLGWLLMWISREKKPEGEVRTFVDRVIGNVWTVMGFRRGSSACWRSSRPCACRYSSSFCSSWAWEPP